MPLGDVLPVTPRERTHVDAYGFHRFQCDPGQIGAMGKADVFGGIVCRGFPGVVFPHGVDLLCYGLAEV